MNPIKINGRIVNVNKLLLNLFLKGVAIVKPNKILKDYIKIKGKCLSISEKKRNIIYKDIEKIYPICIGKATNETAEALKNIFKKKKDKI